MNTVQRAQYGTLHFSGGGKGQISRTLRHIAPQRHEEKTPFFNVLEKLIPSPASQVDRQMSTHHLGLEGKKKLELQNTTTRQGLPLTASPREQLRCRLLGDVKRQDARGIPIGPTHQRSSRSSARDSMASGPEGISDRSSASSSIHSEISASSPPTGTNRARGFPCTVISTSSPLLASCTNSLRRAFDSLSVAIM